jgi:archaemetzincin
MKPIIIILSFFLLMGGCKQSPQMAKGTMPFDVEKEISHNIKTPSLILVRYGDFPLNLIEETKAMLSCCFTEISVIDAVLPDSAYYSPRGRYLTKILLNQLKQFRMENTLVLGVTEKDISTAVYGYNNYGVMGQASLNERVAVVSTWRMGKVKNLQKQDFKKLMLHELAHSVGLSHCKMDDCILHAAERKNRFVHSPSFCDACKRQLLEKGWKGI